MNGHLLRRAGRYWFRRRVPKQLALRIGLKEVCLSLRTYDFITARDRSALMWGATSKAFSMLFDSRLQAAQARALINQMLSESILDSPTSDALSNGLADLDGHAQGQFNDGLVTAVAELPEDQATHVQIQIAHAVARAELKISRTQAAAETVKNDLAKRHIRQLEQRIDELEAALREAEVARRIAEGARVAFGGMPPLSRAVHDATIISGEVSNDTPALLSNPTARAKPSGKPKTPRLSELERPFLADKTHGDGYTGQTVAQVKATFRLFMDLIGDKPLSEYSGTDAGQFRDLVLRMPAAHGKGRKVSPVDAIREADRRETATGILVPRVTMKTAKRHFSALSQLWEWSKPRDYVERNIFRGFAFPGSKTKRNSRSDWSDDDLAQLLGSKFFGANVPRDSADRWLPIIAMFSGLRLEEAARLRPQEDFEEIDGVWLFRIQGHPDGWTPKTEAGDRVVPIHPILVECGLIELVKSRRTAGAARMWPDLSPSGPDQKYGAAFSRKFGKLKEALGIGRNVTFHSFRHNVSTILRNTTTPEAWIDAVMGHEGGEGKSVGASVYLKRIGLANLAATVRNIGYAENVTGALRAALGKALKVDEDRAA